MRGIPAHENALGKKITIRPPKQTDPRGKGERQQGQKEKKGQDPLLRWREGYTQGPHQKWRQLNVELPPTSELTGRPQDDKNSPRGRAGKNAPKSPTVGSVEYHPKRVTPSWRNADQLSKEDFVSIEWEENHTRPTRWPNREATKDTWTE